MDQEGVGFCCFGIERPREAKVKKVLKMKNLAKEDYHEL